MKVYCGQQCREKKKREKWRAEHGPDPEAKKRRARTLTDRQREVLVFIREYTAEHGRLPTLREAAVPLGMASPNGVLRHWRLLEKKGYLLSRGEGRGWDLAGAVLRLEYSDDDAGRRLREAVEDRP